MLIHHPLWFWFLRFPFRRSEAHDARNRLLEAENAEFIFHQRSCPDFAVGTQHMARVGCEVAAVYNALRLIGCRTTAGEIIRRIEETGRLMGFFSVGDLGTDPYAIGECLSDWGVAHTVYTAYSDMRSAVSGDRGRSGVYIVSFWNCRHVFGGLHTVAFYACETDGFLHALNLQSGSGAALVSGLGSLTDRKRFIVGYRLYPA